MNKSVNSSTLTGKGGFSAENMAFSKNGGFAEKTEKALGFLPSLFLHRGGLQRRTGGGATLLLPGQQDTEAYTTSNTFPATTSHQSARHHSWCPPLLERGGSVGRVFVVEAFDPIKELIYFHLFHLALGRGLASQYDVLQVVEWRMVFVVSWWRHKCGAGARSGRAWGPGVLASLPRHRCLWLGRGCVDTLVPGGLSDDCSVGGPVRVVAVSCPVPRAMGLSGGGAYWTGQERRLVDVNSVGRQGSSLCGQATSHKLSTPNQLRAVNLCLPEQVNG